MSSILITGTSRGIGLALASTLAARPVSEVSIVFTAARSESDGLKKLAADHPGRTVFVKMDVTSQADMKTAVAQVEGMLSGKGLDILINNAGVLPLTQGGIEMMTDLAETFQTNVTGVHYVTSSFLPLLEKGDEKRVINMSSTVGSITTVHVLKGVPAYAYKVSKAALNMLTREYAVQLGDRGYTVVAISPGYIKTEGGGENADLRMEEALPPLLKLIDGITKQDNGKFLNISLPKFKNAWGLAPYQGGEYPW